MNKAIGDLSAAEKRALLSELLESKARQNASSAPAGRGILSQFAVSVAELDSEAALDPAIRPSAPLPGLNHAAPAVFLTGATGFLGAFLLDELFKNTGSNVHCLVRCNSVSDGARRIRDNFRNYLPSADYPEGRLTPVPGDLAKPLFGLSDQAFQALAGKIDVVYHNGAYINWLYSFNKLKPTNVLGTQEVLRFACEAKTKPVHYVSTLAVFSLVGDDTNGQAIGEGAPLDHGGILYGGYAQSKWVAEKLVAIGRSRGLPVAIYRPGLITGDSRTGAWNTEDVLSKMMRSWVELGTVPETDAATDMTPVDYVARGIVYLSRREESIGKVFHLFNQDPVHLGELVDGIRSLGFRLRQVTYDEWRSKMVNMTNLSGKHPFASLKPFFNSGAVSAALKGLRQAEHLKFGNTLDSLGNVLSLQYATRSVKFDCQETLEALAGSAIACTKVDRELLKTYFAYFDEKGLFGGAHKSTGVSSS